MAELVGQRWAGTPPRKEPALSGTDGEPYVCPSGPRFRIFKWGSEAFCSQGCCEASTPWPTEVTALGELAQPTSP